MAIKCSVAGLLLLFCVPMPAAAAPPPNEMATLEVRDRAEIHALLIDYGRTLDARDFDGFGRLFARHGIYVTGPGMQTEGADATAQMMRKIMADNPMGFREPNFHVFFNEVIELEGGGRARASSMSLFVAPDAANRPQPMLMARYEDELVREDGRWKFARRTVHSLIPAPQPKR